MTGLTLIKAKRPVVQKERERRGESGKVKRGEEKWANLPPPFCHVLLVRLNLRQTEREERGGRVYFWGSGGGEMEANLGLSLPAKAPRPPFPLFGSPLSLSFSLYGTKAERWKAVHRVHPGRRWRSRRKEEKISISARQKLRHFRLSFLLLLS